MRIGGLRRGFSKFWAFYRLDLAQNELLPIAQNASVAAAPPDGAVRGVDEKPWSSWFGPCLWGRPNTPESGDRSARIESSTMTVPTMRILTDEVLASLIEVADSAPEPGVPLDHLAKLASVGRIFLVRVSLGHVSLGHVSLGHVSLGHVAMIENGSRAAGDGMMRITEIA